MTSGKNITNVRIEQPKKTHAKAQTGPVDSNFNSLLGAMDALTPLNTELMYQSTGSQNAAAVLHGAFTGLSGAAAAYGHAPTSGGAGYGYGYGSLGEYPGMMGVGSAGTYGGYATGGYKASGSLGGDVPGVPGMSTGALMNEMNINNLKLLELQAVMQSNMQAWNTKSNILSADHRARMAMIEKFSARA